MKRLIATVIAMALMTSGVLAHSKTEKTTPANDTTVQKVEIIEMRFDDPMRITAFTVLGPEGAVMVDRQTGMDPVTVFRANPTAVIPPGSYTVDWRGLAVDGHPMQGSFEFSVAD